MLTRSQAIDGVRPGGSTGTPLQWQRRGLQRPVTEELPRHAGMITVSPLTGSVP